MDLMQRRRELMMMGGGYLDGWKYFTTLDTRGNEIPAATLMASPYLDKGGEAISVTWTVGGGGRAVFYDEHYSYVDYWNLNVATRNCPANVRYIRISFPMATIDDCYIYDNTHNKYIWKGKNV